MNGEILNSMFQQSRDQYERALRWTILGVIMLLTFHLLTFGPFVDLEKQLSEAEADKSHLAKRHDAVDEMQASLEALRKEAVDRTDFILEQMLAVLRADFAYLSGQVADIRQGQQAPEPEPIPPDIDLQFQQHNLAPEAIRQLPPAGAPDLEFAYPDERSPPMPSNRGMQFQQQVIPSHMDPRLQQTHGNGARNPFPLTKVKLPRELIQKIRAAESVDEMAELLRPTIEAQIIKPRFETLNSHWRRKILPAIEEQGTEIQQWLQGHEAEEDGDWNTMAEALKRAIKGAKALDFQPPEGSWWRTVAGKGAALDEVQLEIASELDQRAELKGIAKALTDAIKARKAIVDALNAELKRIEENFKKQQTQLDDFAGPLKSVPMDLTIMASRFPLLIGLVLAGLWVWQARRLSELSATVAIFSARLSDDTTQHWLRRRLAPPSGLPPIASLLSQGAMAWIWIGFAAWELRGWRHVDGTQALMLALGGCIAVAIGLIYRRRVVASALAALPPVDH